MSDIKTLDQELNRMILNGKALEAFEKFYADDIEMQENADPPFKGKDVNRKREQEFFASLEQFHGAEVRSTASGDGVTFSEWLLDVTFKGGQRAKLEQVAVRRWSNGKIVRERFYYNKGGK
jgi:ketosteroid isomerase-like protein